MLDLRFVCSHLDEVEKGLSLRGASLDLSGLRKLAGRRRDKIMETEGLRSEMNKANEEMKIKAGKGDRAGIEAARQSLKALSDRIKAGESELSGIEEKLGEMLLTIPNIPHESVPPGKSSDDNREMRIWGTRPEFSFKPRDHWEVGEGLGILDFERAAKVTGSRFVFCVGAGAMLERAIINFMLDVHRLSGYVEIWPPLMVNSKAMLGTGQFPKFFDEAFHVAGTDWHLIPTAEVPVTNLHMDEILSEESLPIKYCSYTPCFRSEAGAAGKDTRGLIRQHQFNKVELVKFSRPGESWNELEGLLADACSILEKLGLCHRVIELCTGDMGFSSAKTYDIEVWFPAQKAFREISSCSNFTDFQARRARIRCKGGAKGKPAFVHTLNGSGLAVGRTVAAILENCQLKDGTVAIPEVLKPYMGGMDIIRKRS